MNLRFIAPEMKNGNSVTKLKVQEIHKMHQSWKNMIFLCSFDHGLKVVNLQCFAKAQWPSIKVLKTLSHKDSYFLLQLGSKSNVEEIVKGGPYFMGR